MARQTTTRPKVVDYLINVGPGSAPIISKAIGLDMNCVSKCLWALRRDGRAHIDGYLHHEGHRHTVYRYGPGEDATPPPAMTQQERDNRRRRRVPNSAFDVSAPTQKWPQLSMMSALMQAPRTRAELADIMACSAARATVVINAARHHGLIYICDYVKPNKRRVPRFLAQTTPFEHPDAKLK